MSRHRSHPAHRDEGPDYALRALVVAWIASLGTCLLALAGKVF
jgi:hypothetical protein